MMPDRRGALGLVASQIVPQPTDLRSAKTLAVGKRAVERDDVPVAEIVGVVARHGLRRRVSAEVRVEAAGLVIDVVLVISRDAVRSIEETSPGLRVLLGLRLAADVHV